MPLATLTTLAVLAGATLVLVRLFALGLREGLHPVRSRVGLQAWATLRLLDDARTWLFPLYSSLLTPVWLRLLGARVGKGVEASTVLLAAEHDPGRTTAPSWPTTPSSAPTSWVAGGCASSAPGRQSGPSSATRG